MIVVRRETKVDKTMAKFHPHVVEAPLWHDVASNVFLPRDRKRHLDTIFERVPTNVAHVEATIRRNVDVGWAGNFKYNSKIKFPAKISDSKIS